MDDAFIIYVEQLREGREKKINEILDPGFLDIQEKELVFPHPVYLEGKAYLAEEELVIHWDIKTDALMPCSICNELVSVAIAIKNFYFCVPINEIKTGIYNFKELLRETILIELPPFTECDQGNCPKRKVYQKYLKESSKTDIEEDEGYHPFADLDWKL